MATIYDIEPNELIEAAAKELQSVDAVQPPEWAQFVKTGHSKEKPPVRKDWWYVRAAAVLRKVYRAGPIGVSKLRTMYGGKKNRGVKAEHSYKGSGSVIRKVLQQLEKAEFLRKGKVGVHKGRIITAKGKSFLNKVATKIYGVKGKESKKVEEAKPVEAEKPKVEAPKAETKGAVKEAPKEEKPKEEVKEVPKEEPKKVEAPKQEKPKEEVKEESKTEPKNG
jgi:small subunit ribosomal protein S19e